MPQGVICALWPDDSVAHKELSMGYYFVHIVFVLGLAAVLYFNVFQYLW